MHPVAAVLRKEVVDNLRDRRTLLSSLLLGPLFGPLFFALAMTVMLMSQLDDIDEPLELPLVGAEHAPNLVAFLEAQNVVVVPAQGDVEKQVKDGDLELAVVIPSSYPDRFRAGEPAALQLISDESINANRKLIRRAERVLQAYGQQIAALRMQVRGVSPQALMPIAVGRVDVSTREGRSVLILGMITYFVLFAALMGGFYLAIDATAGERDRNSLESLMALPIGRRHLMWGKIGATMLFMLISVFICVSAFYVGLKFVPLERLDMSANFTPLVALGIFLVLVPYVVFGTGLLMIVATFTKTQKEAQTYLSLMLALPTMPILFAAITGLRASGWLMVVPSLGQHLLITNLLKAEPLRLDWLVLSVGATLAVGFLLCVIATRRYDRESILL